MGVCFITIIIAFHFQAQNKTTGFAQRKFAFWQRPGPKNSASNAKMSESYE